MSDATLPFSTYVNRVGPQAGFQTRALANPAQIVILGGSAGCGKTSVSIIGAARHKDVPGAGATIFRRNETHIKIQGGLWDEAKRVYPLLGGVPHESKPMHWAWPHNPGFRVAMSHLAQENTVEDWQGSQLPLICCEVGTRIRMADGTSCPVEELHPGDMVATLAGPRSVTKTYDPHVAPCVRVTVEGAQGEIIGEQVQSASHGLLTDLGWRSYDDMFGAPLPASTYGSTGCHSSHKSVGPSDRRSLSASPPPDILACHRAPRPEPSQSQQGHQSWSETDACRARRDPGNDSGSSPGSSQVPAQPLSIHLRAVVAERWSSSSARSSFLASVADEASCELTSTGQRGSQGRCSSLPRPRDALAIERGDIDRGDARPQGDAAEQIRRGSLLDERGTTQTRIHRKLRYAHPYTGEERTAGEETAFASCSIAPCGDRLVVHLSIEGESHYITEIGLINRNCFDELTHFLASQFWYMVSRNRSVCGVEPRIMATCNPDVDSWVADLIAWWIDQEPTLRDGTRNPRYGYFIPERAGKIRFFGREGDRLVWGNSRAEVIAQVPRLGRGNPRDMVKSLTFIPGLLSDNAILEAANPQYRGNLEGMIEVQRLRLLGGNWKVRASAGDYFREEDFEVLPDIPNDVVMWARRWDLAATKPSDSNPDPDWTYGVLMGRRENGHYVIADARPLRDRSEKVRKLIMETAAEDGQHVYVGIPQDPGQAGVDQVDDYVADLAGFNVWVDRETGDKETRVEPLATQSQRGHVSVVRGRWNAQFFGQMVAFPSKSAHDDAPDAAAGAFTKVKGGVTMFEAA